MGRSTWMRWCWITAASLATERSVHLRQICPRPRQLRTVCSRGHRSGRRLARARRNPRSPLPTPRDKPLRGAAAIRDPAGAGDLGRAVDPMAPMIVSPKSALRSACHPSIGRTIIARCMPSATVEDRFRS